MNFDVPLDLTQDIQNTSSRGPFLQALMTKLLPILFLYRVLEVAVRVTRTELASVD